MVTSTILAGREKNAPRVIESPYLTAHEAVEYLRLPSLRQLYKLVNEQRLPHGRRGRVYLFDIRKLDRWVESCGVTQDVERFQRRA